MLVPSSFDWYCLFSPTKCTTCDHHCVTYGFRFTIVPRLAPCITFTKSLQQLRCISTLVFHLHGALLHGYGRLSFDRSEPQLLSQSNPFPCVYFLLQMIEWRGVYNVLRRREAMCGYGRLLYFKLFLRSHLHTFNRWISSHRPVFTLFYTRDGTTLHVSLGTLLFTVCTRCALRDTIKAWLLHVHLVQR